MDTNLSRSNPGFEDDDGSCNPREQQKVEELKHNGDTVVSLSQLKEIDDPDVPPVEVVDPTHPIDDDEEDDGDYSLLSFLPNYQELKKQYKEYAEEFNLKVRLKQGFLLALGLAFISYFISVLAIQSKIQNDNYWCTGDGLLVILTILTAIGLIYFQIIKPHFGEVIYKELFNPLSEKISILMSRRVVKFGVYIAVILAVAIFLIVDTAGDRQRLASVFGMFVILLFGFIFSAAPRKIVWRHVVWGLALQFLMGLVILRWNTGRHIFQCMGDKVHAFLKFTDEGSEFVFGTLVSGQLNYIDETLKDKVDMLPIFGFKVLTVVLFFSFCIQILYYYGIMQWVVIKLGWCLQVTIGTTACESVNASANIFLGQSEAPLLIKPYLNIMTESELHAVLTGGFATVAGSVLAAFINFGVNPTHLLSASVMSAPAALAFSKLFYPETKKSITTADDIQIVKGDESNVLHAALNGVTNVIPLVANIAANLVAFISFIAFFNSVFNWSCQLVDIEKDVCTLENVFGYIFMPLAWLMGVEWKECHLVGELVGLKTIVNEFVAYLRLVEMKKDNLLSERAETISTYALCGFSNITSIGIQLGALGAMAPDRQGTFSKLAVRAMIAGSCACFLTACVAGTLIEGSSGSSPAAGNSTIL